MTVLTLPLKKLHLLHLVSISHLETSPLGPVG